MTGNGEDVVDDIGDVWRNRALAAVLDDESGSHLYEIDQVPPLGHWLMFRATARQSDIGADGHPRMTGREEAFNGLRRMWAASDIEFFAPIPLGRPVRRRSRLCSIEEKPGRSGPLIFATREHSVSCDDEICLRERQHIVYRPPSGGPVAGGEMAQEGAWRKRFRPDGVMLLRYSALTFNAHRIHYDRDYAVTVEGYPGLVMHGPLAATLLMDLFRRMQPHRAVRTFRFKAKRPLFAGRDLVLHGRSTAAGAELWIADGDGLVAMTANIETGDAM